MVGDSAKHDIPSEGLAEELLARSFGNGANAGLWPGMTIYRYVEPTVPKWEEIQSLSVCIVAQGRKAVTADGHHYVYDRAGQQEDGNPVAAALNYINAHLSEPLTVEILAGQVNLSSSGFSRRFREITGKSPYQFVKETRVERARELLLERRLRVTDISITVGYASLSHFTTEFRARFGTTPREYADADGLSRDLRATR